jgi:hypothetical protein
VGVGLCRVAGGQLRVENRRLNVPVFLNRMLGLALKDQELLFNVSGAQTAVCMMCHRNAREGTFDLFIVKTLGQYAACCNMHTYRRMGLLSHDASPIA